MRNAVVVVLVGVLLGACAFTPHDVVVNTKVPVAPSSIGDDTVVALEFLDDRDDLVVGQRGVGMQGADITAPGVMFAVTQEVTLGLEAHGFKVVDTKESASSKLEVRLRAFKFFVESGFWTGAINTSAVIGVEARVGTAELKRIYRSSDEENSMIIPGGSEIDTKLNIALSNVLIQLVNDEELMGFLASPVQN